MRRALIVIGLLALLLGLLWRLGPQVEIDETLHPQQLPADLPRWLADREAQHADLVPGTEKRIVWAQGVGQRTDRVFVYLHGFSASRQETAPLMEQLAAQWQANLFETRLSGHGRSGEALAGASVNAWLNDAVEALAIAERLGDEVIVVGVSTGGALAWWLAAQAPQGVDRLILISPNFRLRAAGAGLMAGPWGELLARLMLGEERGFEPLNAAQAKYWTERYPSRALLPMLGLLKLVSTVPATRITQPVLAIYSPEDRVVDAQYSEQWLGQLPETRLRQALITNVEDPNQHVLAGDILSPGSTATVAEAITEFLQRRD